MAPLADAVARRMSRTLLTGPSVLQVNGKAAKQSATDYMVVGKPTPDVKTEYDLGKVLGKGQFGTTRLATHKKTGEKLACKSISKRKLVTSEDIADVKREIQIMDHLAGHPNVVTYRGVYEDKQSVHIVMELCSGGELFDRIVALGHYTEKDAAAAIRTMVQVGVSGGMRRLPSRGKQLHPGC